MLSRSPRRDTGFTLIELVMSIVLIGALAAIALPRFVDLRHDARVASVAALTGALHSTAHEVHMKCRVMPACNDRAGFFNISINGKTYRLVDGFPEAGDNLGNNQIDTLLIYRGFTPTLVNNLTTRFESDGAAAPAACSVTYAQSTGGGVPPVVTATTTGC
jgi:MSHA pilin protein MshA